MTRVQYAPGLYYEPVAPAAEPSPLRSDVAGFVGRTRRGPVSVAVRVTGWRECQMVFGGLAADADTPLALQGYFDNGGDVAHVVRLLGHAPSGNPAELIAAGSWDLTRPNGAATPLADWDPLLAGFPARILNIMASSPGAWANGLHVSARFRQTGASGHSEVDLVVRARGEDTEFLIGLEPAAILDQVAQRSALIRVAVPAGLAAAAALPGTQPRLLRWPDVVLAGGADPAVGPEVYQDALVALQDEPEVALLVMPDLFGDLGADAAASIHFQAVQAADAAHDRMVLVDLPSPALDSSQAVACAAYMRAAGLGNALRSAAIYYPWLEVQDPLGGTTQPLRTIVPSGHVAGVISRLDRERGPQYTPANVSVADAMNVVRGLSLAERAALNDAGVNALRCLPGAGIQVWGGRTLYLDSETGQPDTRQPGQLYIAHRRLVHRLVRAIRRVAEPLVFESNGPPLWLALTRAITTVLVEAYRAGGLQGNRPEEAFQVRCDATNNPPDAIERGEVLCEIRLAPAVPMEFLTIRVSLSAAGTLDVFEQ